jgi:hypothetical protein
VTEWNWSRLQADDCRDYSVIPAPIASGVVRGRRQETGDRRKEKGERRKEKGERRIFGDALPGSSCFNIFPLKIMRALLILAPVSSTPFFSNQRSFRILQLLNSFPPIELLPTNRSRNHGGLRRHQHGYSTRTRLPHDWPERRHPSTDHRHARSNYHVAHRQEHPKANGNGSGTREPGNWPA